MIFIGYPGIGKSTLAKKHFVIDLESNSFWYKDDLGYKVRDARWYEYYCNVAENLCEQGFNVFVSSHGDVCRRLRISPYPVVTIHPSLKLKEEWIGKLEERFVHTGLEKDFTAYTRACSYYDADIRCMMENAPHKHIEITDIDYDLWSLIEPVLWAEMEAGQNGRERSLSERLR